MGSSAKLISLRSPDKLPRSIIYDGGFKILGTPLAFKGAKNPGLLFYSDMDMPIPRGTRRIIGTSEAMNTLATRKRKIDAIAVGYERMFKLGRMDLRLLPSGMGPGSSLLQISVRDTTILYCSGVQRAKSLSGLQADTPKCDIILLDFDIPTSRPPASKTSKSNLQKWIQSNNQPQRAAAVCCASANALFEAHAALATDAKTIVAHHGAYQLLKNTSQFHNIRRLGASWPKDGIVLGLYKSFEKMRFATHDDIPKCYCGPTQDSPTDMPVFRFGEPEHMAGLLDFSRSCNAHTVAISPRGKKQTALAFKKAGFTVYFSPKPTQLKLPL